MTTTNQKNRIRRALLDWAATHNLVINPSKGMEQAVDNYLEFGYCPCDVTRSRTVCPCPESLQDIEATGHCLCRLFWRDYEAYRAILKEDVDEQENGGGSPQPDSGGGGG